MTISKISSSTEFMVSHSLKKNGIKKPLPIVIPIKGEVFVTDPSDESEGFPIKGSLIHCLTYSGEVF